MNFGVFISMGKVSSRFQLKNHEFSGFAWSSSQAPGLGSSLEKAWHNFGSCCTELELDSWGSTRTLAARPIQLDGFWLESISLGSTQTSSQQKCFGLELLISSGSTCMWLDSDWRLPLKNFTLILARASNLRLSRFFFRCDRFSALFLTMQFFT